MLFTLMGHYVCMPLPFCPQHCSSVNFEIRKCETFNFFSRLFWLFRHLLRFHINASISAKDIGIFDRGGHLMRRDDSLEKTLMLGGIGGRRRRGREDEMAGWHHRLDERESEWTPGDGDGQ